jgi:hypothetical protein
MERLNMHHRHFKRLRISCLTAILLLPFSVSAKAPKFPSPPDASVEWVSKNLTMNGIKNSIRAFHSNKTIEKVVEFYRKEWENPPRGGKLGYTETIVGSPWYILTRVEDGYLMTVMVQVQENNKKRSWGYLSTSPLPKNPKKPLPALGGDTAKMTGSDVMNEMKTNDPGKKATTMIISNEHSIHRNAMFYRKHYEGMGWTKESDHDAGDVKTLVYKTRKKRTTIVLQRDGSGSKIIVNSVKNTMF